MTAQKNQLNWQVGGKSVRGAAHIRHNLPNQDAISWLGGTGSGLPIALAVSDGHGSARYFRSDRGAALAVDSATTLLYDLATNQTGDTSLSALKRAAEERLPQALVRHWQEQVQAALAHTPLTDEELAQLADKSGLAARQTVLDQPLLAYGATLVAVLVTETYILYLQLGDGDILTVADDLSVSRPPLAGDERLFGDETTSLCTNESWRDMRVCFQAIVHTPPALIVLSTDGYSRSFTEESGFLQVGSDLLQMLRSDGFATVQAELPGWLEEASQSGSGDDISLGFLWKCD
ncbi:MAG: protein phosphatase 2C domain-containing protein [Chloroflexaceae bacterium]|nr:protein phosphatase 2C domain-containing protein [Chloroflexaceae bacterium]